ncbi:hypothetical protein EBESD8_56680 [Rhodococcus aetherivorans]|nr:hypothetical protein EBESD8_56680 [Rhodococcus aetherivorans]
MNCHARCAFPCASPTTVVGYFGPRAPYGRRASPGTATRGIRSAHPLYRGKADAVPGAAGADGAASLVTVKASLRWRCRGDYRGKQRAEGSGSRNDLRVRTSRKSLCWRVWILRAPCSVLRAPCSVLRAPCSVLAEPPFLW